MFDQMPWSRYTLPNGNKIYLTSRPDGYAKEGYSFSSTFYLATGDHPHARIYFTDDLILDTVPTTTPSTWVPWFVDEDKRESDNPTLSSIATAVSLIKSYDCHSTIYGGRNIIWLHCDSSSMRAPTYFGLFLNAFYPDQINLIMSTLETNMSDDYQRSSPKRYAQIDLDRDPKVRVVLDQIKEKLK